MNKPGRLALFAAVTGFILVGALIFRDHRAGPRDSTQRTAGPSAVEEAGQNREDYRGPGSNVRAPQREVQSPMSDVRTPRSGRPRTQRQSVKSAVDLPRTEERSPQQAHTGPPVLSPSQPSAGPAILPVPAIPQPAGGHNADEPAPASPVESIAPSPPPPDVLRPPVLLTEPTQDGEGPQIALDGGSLTTQLRFEIREGRVELKILVRADGTVARAEVAHSSGQSALDQAAVLAVSSWRFAPATRNGAPIEAWVLIPVRFVVR